MNKNSDFNFGVYHNFDKNSMYNDKKEFDRKYFENDFFYKFKTKTNLFS